MNVIDSIENILMKRVLATSGESAESGGREYCYNMQFFLSKITDNSRNIAAEIITITDEAAYETDGGKREIIKESVNNLVNIYRLEFESIRGSDKLRGVMYLKNTSSKEMKYPSLKAEVYSIKVSDEELIWSERYHKADNPDTADSVLEYLNALNRKSRIYISENTSIIEYNGSTIISAPLMPEFGSEPYMYSFSAHESKKSR